MELIVETTNRLKGSVTPPSSKSHSVRAVLLASLCRGTSKIRNLLKSDDTEAALDIAKALGANIEERKDMLLLNGFGLPLNPKDRLFSRDSGISTKFTLPLLGFQKDGNKTIILDAGEQMRRRPIMPLVETLNKLGMNIVPARSDCPFPLAVSGILRGGIAEVDGKSSQYISALLLALPLAPADSVMRVKNLQERPYVDMTLSWLDRLGVFYKHSHSGDTDLYEIPGQQAYLPFEISIPGDFSSASYTIAAAALIHGDVLVKGLDMNDPQSDKRLIEILRDMGADIQKLAEGLQIRGRGTLRGMTIDANDIPDMLPTLAVVGACAEGETRIVNVAHARIKETDRIHSMYEGLKAMGADIEELPDGLLVRQSRLTGARVHGCHDHRSVMALALAGMIAEGQTVIDTAESVGKTYPGFVEDMKGLGGVMALG
ncbi:MAG: 3-phosphoshikimate 1-carboxyvinyltransferase [Candidatus Magasanikbacteria bacterium]|nr:3-phosphoshikimate 1-carboxyvinyltransferase [Candidatus Magasanikbacteria bacterium]